MRRTPDFRRGRLTPRRHRYARFAVHLDAEPDRHGPLPAEDIAQNTAFLRLSGANADESLLERSLCPRALFREPCREQFAAAGEVRRNGAPLGGG